MQSNHHWHRLVALGQNLSPVIQFQRRCVSPVSTGLPEARTTQLTQARRKMATKMTDMYGFELTVDAQTAEVLKAADAIAQQQARCVSAAYSPLLCSTFFMLNNSLRHSMLATIACPTYPALDSRNQLCVAPCKRRAAMPSGLFSIHHRRTLARIRSLTV